MMTNKYLVHDLYHITQNFTVMKGSCTYDELMEFVMKSGKKNGHDYNEKMIRRHLNHLVTIRTIHKNKDGGYYV